ncbi:MAG: hypothetical protein HDQ98_17650 [Lachnospiraceae bacterium]|nr:hypothetical protein [Lachnospiraceae bacterium]
MDLYTVEHIEEMTALMNYGTHFICALLAIACLAYMVIEVRHSVESHDIRKEIRKLEKEKLELELKMLKKSE